MQTLEQPKFYGMSDIENGVLYETLPEGAQLRKIFIDYAKPLDTTFAQYGHIFYRALVQDAKGRWTNTSRIKYWEKDGNYAGILPLGCPVYPFEPMNDDIRETIDLHIKDVRFKVVRQDVTHNGFAAYWTLLSDDIRGVVKGSYVRDDVVQIGLVIRNGINCNVSLGADFYTYRLACSNGALGSGDNFGSMSIRHFGDRKRIIESFKQGIPLIIKTGQKILEYYEMAAAFKFDEAMARKIFKRTQIAEKYFPQYYHIDKDQKDPDKRVSLTNEGKQISLWEAFNDLTEPLTKSFNLDPVKRDKDGKPILKENGEFAKTVKLGFSGFSRTTRDLHRCLVQIIDARKRGAAEGA